MAIHTKSNYQRGTQFMGEVIYKSESVAVARPADSSCALSGMDTSRDRASFALFDPDGAPRHPTDSTSVSLISACCQVLTGHAEAFATLMEQCRHQAVRYRSLVRHPDDFDDLQQELWVTLWRALQTHPPRVLEELCSGGGAYYDF